MAEKIKRFIILLIIVAISVVFSTQELKCDTIKLRIKGIGELHNVNGIKKKYTKPILLFTVMFDDHVTAALSRSHVKCDSWRHWSDHYAVLEVSKKVLDDVGIKPSDMKLRRGWVQVDDTGCNDQKGNDLRAIKYNMWALGETMRKSVSAIAIFDYNTCKNKEGYSSSLNEIIFSDSVQSEFFFDITEIEPVPFDIIESSKNTLGCQPPWYSKLPR